MPTSKQRRPQSRRFAAEPLEGRQLLSTLVTGTDPDGDAYSLSLLGPGTLVVTNQDGASPQIDAITIQGANPARTRLIGVVTPNPNGMTDGRVFFDELVELDSDSPGSSIGVGMLAIDMPDFWLTDTDPISDATPGGSINVPDGVATLRFGGVDSTALGNSTDGQTDTYSIDLGLPNRIGTSIIVDQLISSIEVLDDDSGTTFADTIDIDVSGRINVFQANEVLGDSTPDNPTMPFPGSTTAGTEISSLADAGLTGAIGRFQIGGEATDLTVTVATSGGDDNARITNFFIGGETSEVTVIAPTLIRTARFGLGLDTVALSTADIELLEANRGATASTVLVDRVLNRANFGGNVINTQIMAGNIGTGLNPTPAQAGGDLTIQVAGDVVDSIITASVDPMDGIFGNNDDIVIPQGFINAKVGGLIIVDDAESTPDSTFFGQTVRFEVGPIIPPTVPMPPFIPRPLFPGRTPTVFGIAGRTSSPSLAALQRRLDRSIP